MLRGQVPGGALLVVNQGDRTLSVLDPSSGRELKTLPVGGVTGHEVAVVPGTHTAVVPVYGDSGVGKPGTDGASISFLDLDKGALQGKVAFSHGVRPHAARFDPHSGQLFVTTEIDRTVTVIDPRTLKITGTVPTGEPESHMLVLTHDGKRAYTANVHSGTVSVLDLPGRKLLKVIHVADETQRIALSPDERFVFTSDQTAPKVAVVDTATNAVVPGITLPSIGYGLTPTPDNRWLLVALRTANQVAVIDMGQRRVVKVLTVPKGPTEILLAPGAHQAYVSCGGDGKVAVISLADWQVTKVLNAGKGADGLAWFSGKNM